MIYLLNKLTSEHAVGLAHVVYNEYAEDTSENAVEIVFPF